MLWTFFAEWWQAIVAGDILIILISLPVALFVGQVLLAALIGIYTLFFGSGRDGF